MLTQFSNQNIIIAYFETSWGEIDWLAPVLFELKELKPDWRIVSVFSQEWRAYNLRNKQEINNRTLYRELNNISDDIIYESELENVINPEHVRIVFAHSSLNEFNLKAKEKFPYANVYMYPDAPYIYIDQKFKQPRWTNRWQKIVVNQDYLLVDSKGVMPLVFQTRPDIKVSVVGTPRFDTWWINKLLANSNELNAETKATAGAKRVYLFLTSYTHPQYTDFPPDIHDYVIESVAETILADKQNFLLIKPHPRQNIDLLLSRLKGFDRSKWMISNLHAMQLSNISDFVISVASSALIDALAVEKPVVVFHPYVWPYHNLTVDQYGRLHSIFDLMELSIDLRTRKELIRHINNYFNDENKLPIWKKQQQAFNTLFPRKKRASRTVAKFVLDLIEERTENLLPIYGPGTSVTGEKNIFLTTDNNGCHALNFEMKRIMAFGMPISSDFLREIAIVFNLETLIATGSFNENFASESSTIFQNVHHIEAASDLYQAVIMKNIENRKNIHLYHSANLLRMILPGIKGRKLCWLSCHEIVTKTWKSKTNTPIIEELKIIKEYYNQDTVILIDNVRFFQPVRPNVDEPRGDKERKYPELQQALDAIVDIDPHFIIAILGDIAIIYPPGYPVSISKGIRACTLSRLFNGANINQDVLLEAEKTIAFGLSETEKEAVRALHKDYGSLEDSSVGGHYHLWNGLILFGENRFAEAKEEIYKALKLGCILWSGGWFLAQSAYYSGDISFAKKTLEAVIHTYPAFESAHILMNHIQKTKDSTNAK